MSTKAYTLKTYTHEKSVCIYVQLLEPEPVPVVKRLLNEFLSVCHRVTTTIHREARVHQAFVYVTFLFDLLS